MWTAPKPNGSGGGAASSSGAHGGPNGHFSHAGANANANANAQPANAVWAMFPTLRQALGNRAAPGYGHASHSSSQPTTAQPGLQAQTGWQQPSFNGIAQPPYGGSYTPSPQSQPPPGSTIPGAQWPLLSGQTISAPLPDVVNTAAPASYTAAPASTPTRPAPTIPVSTPVPSPLSSSQPNRPTPVFKNPLDKYGSPPPASKRQKKDNAHRRSSGSGSGSDGNPHIKTSPVMSRSQPILVGGGLGSGAIGRTSSWGGSSPMSATQRLAQKPMAPPRPKVPSGWKQSVEDSKVVYVLDDDDDDDDGAGAVVSESVRSSAPPPTQVNMDSHASHKSHSLTFKPALFSPIPPSAPLLSASAPPTLKNIAPPPAPMPSHAPSSSAVSDPAPALAVSTPTSIVPAPAISDPIPTPTPAPAVTTSSVPAPSISAPAAPTPNASVQPLHSSASSPRPHLAQPPPPVQKPADIPRQAHNPATAWLTSTTIPISPLMNAAGRGSDGRFSNGNPDRQSMAFEPSPSSSFGTLSQIPAAPVSLPPSLPPSFAVQHTQTQFTQQTQAPQTQHPPPSTKKSQPIFTRFATLDRRPYLQSKYREFIVNHYRDVQKLLGQAKDSPAIHVDLLPNEVQVVLNAIRSFTMPTGPAPGASKLKTTAPEKDIKTLLKKKNSAFVSAAVHSVNLSQLPGRHYTDIMSYISDVRAGFYPPSAPAALVLTRKNRVQYSQHEKRVVRTTKLGTLLFGREMTGQRIVSGRMRQPVHFTNEIRKLREDSLTPYHQWTNCAGDVTTISWTSDDTFICGTTTHMDDRNHQYNRQGNLALACLKTGQLTAYPDHRIIRRPQARPGYPNSAHSHDDPWLYTSVVSSDYASALKLSFTSSFDETVKAWRVEEDGTMLSMGTWRHKGKVNFVVASTHEMGLVATATDAAERSVRIYRFFNPHENGRITYKTLPCPRIFDAAGRALIPDKWAYLPAAVRWGLTKDTNHLLLVGFSPRGLGLTADDEDIPLDQRDTGDLRLWDGRDGSAWQVNGPRRNIFEVAWHPTQACFIAATAPKYHGDENTKAYIRTQIRIYRQTNTSDNGGRVFSEVQTLDCFAEDINELALLPNSIAYMFVAAGATNGRTYVWDTSQGDNPIHILEHDKCLEELAGEQISTEDTGVKFVAWGQTPDRLYTGSSDGVVKVWNVRTHRSSNASPFVRELLRCPAPVSFGAFSPDKSKLAIGDASGRVTVLSVDDNLDTNDEDAPFLSDSEDEADIPAKDAIRHRPQGQHQQHQNQHHAKTFRQHPREIIRHSTPPPPPPQVPTAPAPPASLLQTQAQLGSAPTNAAEEQDDDGCTPAKEFLASGQIMIVADRTVGAVKGPNYAQTNLYRREFHRGRQPHEPLLAEYERMQQENQLSARSAPSRQRPLKVPSANKIWVNELHQLNKRRDLTIQDLDTTTISELMRDDSSALQLLIEAAEGVEEGYDFGFDYEELPADL